jgi:hypothetical protein
VLLRFGSILLFHNELLVIKHVSVLVADFILLSQDLGLLPVSLQTTFFCNLVSGSYSSLLDCASGV